MTEMAERSEQRKIERKGRSSCHSEFNPDRVSSSVKKMKNAVTTAENAPLHNVSLHE